MNCPECGEALQPGVRVCPNCEYELTDAEMAQNGGAAPAAPEKPSVSAPSRPTTSAPTAPTNPVKPVKPAKPAAPDVAMPESIMAHGDVSVASHQQDDHSVHHTQNTTNNTQNNVANNTTNNTQQTIIINVGAGGQLPGGIVDEQTTRAVNEVAAQQAQQQPRKPQQPKPQPQQQEVPTFTDKPQKDEKGVGSITGEGTIYVQTGKKMPGWLIGLIVVVIIGAACAFLFSGRKASPEPEGQMTETVTKPAETTKPATKKPAATTTTTTPATTTTTTPAAPSATTTPSTTSGTTTSTRPATTTARAVADPYQDGMSAYQNGDYDKAVEQLSKAAASAEKKKAAEAAYKLGLMYETGDGVAVDKKQAIEWYEKAAKLGSKEAKRKLM